MQANPNDHMDREYQNLTEKQRAVIDAHAKHPDETNREKARIAGEEILGQGEPINESYCSEIINKDYAELAKYREEIEQNERVEGTQQTIGDPFANLDSGNSSFQSIKDRPVKSTTDDEDEPEPQRTQQQPQVAMQQSISSPTIQVADTGDGIAVKLSYRYVQQLLESQQTMLPEELHEQLVDVVLQRAFN